jgi:hypothetical protein
MAYKPSKPGAQDPSRYPFVGQNYSNWGEQTGFIYDPYRDAYMPDRSAAQNYYQSQGLVKPDVPGADTVKSPNGHTYSWQNGQWVDTTPKQPGLLEQAMPLGVAALAVEGGKQGAQALPGLFSSGGLFSGGAAPVAQGAASGAGTAASSGGVGLLGSGGAASSAAPAAQATGAGLVSEGAGATGAGASQLAGGAASTFPSGFGLLPAAGIAAGAYTGYQQFQGVKNMAEGKNPSWLQHAALFPITGGLDVVARGLGLFQDGDKWKTERRKLDKLKDKGIYVPENLAAANLNKAQGRNAGYRQELGADFIGRDEQGNWVNNKFAQSRNVADLRPEDIVNYSAFAEKDPEWFKKPLDQRLQIADQALQAGAVSEGKGSIKVDWKKVGSQPQPSPLPQGNQGRPAQPINQGSPGMRPRNQGRPSQPMRP